MYKVSVIVPIYNVEKYLEKCIKSILDQNLKGIEIILVNDGSTDNCEKICKYYLKLDSRIKYYYKQNGGLSSARNYGITKANGEYLYFVDSDDYLEPNTCEVLYNEAIQTGAELVVGGYRTIDKQTGILEEYIPTMALKFYELKDYDSKSAFIDSLIKERIIIEVIWNKLYHRSIFDKISFPYRRFEDSFMCFDIYNIVKSIAFVDSIIYNYLVNRKGSITSSHNIYDIERLDSYYVKAYSFYSAYSKLKSTSMYYYMCLKTILKRLNSKNELRYVLAKEIKSLPASKIGLRNKIKTLFRYR